MLASSFGKTDLFVWINGKASDLICPWYYAAFQIKHKAPTKECLGAWHNSKCWDGVASNMKEFAYQTEAVQLPSSGNLVASHLDDTAVVRKALEVLIISEQKPVILVMHSYGGVAGATAVSGLEATKRHERGESGGIIHCLFVSAFLIPRGKTLVEMYPDPPPQMIPDVSCISVDLMSLRVYEVRAHIFAA